MKIIKLLMIAIMISVTSIAKAQFMDTKVLFYVFDGNFNNPQNSVLIYQFKQGHWFWANGVRDDLRQVCNNLRENSNYYESKANIWSDKTKEIAPATYDSSMSTPKWTVYSYYDSGITPSGVYYADSKHYYYAFNNDYTQFIEWEEDGASNIIGEKRVWTGITKEELVKLKFTGTRDFLQ